MALDNRNRRASAVAPSLPFRSVYPLPDGTLASEERYLMAGFYGGLVATAPVQLEQIGNISVRSATGTHQFDFADRFSGETSYSISPALEVGWSFNTSTGVLIIDTDANGDFGPYVVRATNASGNVDSNGFTVRVSDPAGTAYRGLTGNSIRRLM